MSDSQGIKVLTGDKRTKEMKHWTQWFRQVPAIRRKFRLWTEDFDPFHSNEAASVAVLANAAAKAGYLAHTEYVALKHHASQGRPFRPGRCDLWIADVESERSWAFEVKQHFAATNTRQSTFDARLERARKDAKDLDRDEADLRVGCLIAVPRLNLQQTPQIVQHFDGLYSQADVAFRIGGGVGSIWLAFAFVD